MVSCVLVTLLQTLIDNFQNRFDQGFILLSLLLLHVLDIIKQGNQALDRLNSDHLILVLEILDEELEECRVEWLQRVTRVIENQAQENKPSLPH